MEIQISYNTLSQIINRKMNLLNDSRPEILIFDESNRLLYPYEQNSESSYKYLKAFNNMVDTSLVAKINNQNYTLVRSQSEDTGFTFIIAQTHSILFESLNGLRNIIIVFGLFSILITLLITYQISSSLTLPIRAINESIDKLTLDTLPKGSNILMNAKVNELDHLQYTFQNMCSRFQKSLDDNIKMRSMEAHSRMLALQSQMNPHFLFNTLTTISILAENNKGESIVNVCEDLSDMMRYITSEASNYVTFQEEIKHTESYINLMYIRFENNLFVKINIDPDMLNIRIPKLIVQPLVENSIKYATKNLPPWKIQINGWIQNDYWFVKVIDNGPGFTELAIHDFNNKINKHSHSKQNLKLEGMGLINIYTRLKLKYGENFIFEFGNNVDKGAFVLFGSPR